MIVYLPHETLINLINGKIPTPKISNDKLDHLAKYILAKPIEVQNVFMTPVKQFRTFPFFFLFIKTLIASIEKASSKGPRDYIVNFLEAIYQFLLEKESEGELLKNNKFKIDLFKFCIEKKQAEIASFIWKKTLFTDDECVEFSKEVLSYPKLLNRCITSCKFSFVRDTFREKVVERGRYKSIEILKKNYYKIEDVLPVLLAGIVKAAKEGEKDQSWEMHAKEITNYMNCIIVAEGLELELLRSIKDQFGSCNKSPSDLFITIKTLITLVEDHNQLFTPLYIVIKELFQKTINISLQSLQKKHLIS